MVFRGPFSRIFPAPTPQDEGIVLNFLLYERFLTPDAAPVNSPYSCEIGTLVFTQAGSGPANHFSIANGRLHYATTGTSGNGGAAASTDAPPAPTAYPRTPGLAIAATLNYTLNTALSQIAILWKAALNFIPGVGGGARWGMFSTAGQLGSAFDLQGSFAIHPHWYGHPYQVACVLENPGGLVFIKGGIYEDWKLVFASRLGTTTPVYATLSSANGGGIRSQDMMSIAQLPAPFDDDDNFITSQYAGAVPVGQQFAHEADCNIVFTIATLPLVVKFRIVDTNNFWSVEVTSGGALTLNVTVAGAKTLIASGTATVGSVITVCAYKYILHISNVPLQVPFANTNHANATSGEVTSGGITNLVAYAMSLPEGASDILDAMYVGDAPVHTKQLIAHGDSIAAGLGGGNVTSIFPEKATTILGASWAPASYGIPGQTIATMATHNPYVLSMYNPNLERNVVLYYLGTNDLRGDAVNASSMTPLATMQSGYAAMCLAAKNAGLEVAACTLASIGGTAFDVALEAQRQAFNAWLVLNYTSFADILIDYGGDPDVGAPGACTNPALFSVDQTHPNDAGHLKFGQITAAAVA